MLEAALSMSHSMQTILQSIQNQTDVYEEFLQAQDVTKENLEDVTKEVLEEKKMGATLILTQPSLRSGCVNLLLGLIPTQTLYTSGSPMLQI